LGPSVLESVKKRGSSRKVIENAYSRQAELEIHHRRPKD